MKRRYKILTALLVSTQLLGAVSPVMASEPLGTHRFIDDEAYTDTYRDDYQTYLNNREYGEQLQEALEGLKERSENIENNEQLNLLINDFTTVHTAMDTDDAGRFHAESQLLGYDLALEVFENIRDAIYDEGSQTRVIRFANRLGLGTNHGVTGFNRLIQNLVDTNPIEGAQSALEEVQVTVSHARYYIGYGVAPTLEIVGGKLVTPIDEKAVEAEMKEDPLLNPGTYIDIEYPGSLAVEDNSVLDTADITDYDEDYVPKAVGDNQVTLPPREGTYYEFNAEAQQRIRIDYVITVENGEEKRTETRTVEADGLSSMWSDRFAQHISGTINATTPTWANESEEEVEEESNLTLQYTLNKNDAFPVYVDTGLYTEVDGSAAYEDVYEVLYQIAVNTDNGYLVEDADKLLAIVESRPVYIQEQDAAYTQDAIESMFETFEDVELIVAETRIGTTDSLEWQLRTGQEQRVQIDGEEVPFHTTPNVRSERVVLPIVEMMEAIGGVVEMDDSILTARYNGQVIRFEEGVQDARVDNELVSLSVPVERNEHGVYTANLMPIFGELGIDALWDEQESTLVLDGTLREDMLEKQAEEAESESDGEYTPGIDSADEDITEDEIND